MPLLGVEEIVTLSRNEQSIKDLIEILGWRNADVHDAIVYDIKHEFDPKNKEMVEVAAEMICNEIGVHIDGFSADASKLIPIISSEGFREYVREHDLRPNEWVYDNILDREEKERKPSVASYVPDHDQLNTTLNEIFNKRCNEIKRNISPSKHDAFVNDIWTDLSEPGTWGIVLFAIVAIIYMILKY